MFGRKDFYRVAVVVSLFACLNGERFARRTGYQALDGHCVDFKLGGNPRLHFYTCCNNCNDNVDKSCDGTTYHSASPGNYCDSCGRDNARGNGALNKGFACGGCEGQAKIASKCIDGWKNKYKNIPGFC